MSRDMDRQICNRSILPVLRTWSNRSAHREKSAAIRRRGEFAGDSIVLLFALIRGEMA
jgi:hypothetical protein